MENTGYDVQGRLSKPVQEAYKVLRTNIQFSGIDEGIKTLAVTSCTSGEGKTTTCINLAVSMAKAGMKILLVDADLRKSMVSKYKLVRKYIKSDNVTGLTKVITGYANINEAVNPTDVEGLYFLPSGPRVPNPAELIGSIKFSQFLDDVKKEYEMVIIDTPPLGSVIDCALIASKTDGTLLVIRSKAVDIKSAQRVKAQLKKAKARILGVVLTRIDKSEYKKYYIDYNYYGTDRGLKETRTKRAKHGRKSKLGRFL